MKFIGFITASIILTSCNRPPEKYRPGPGTENIGNAGEGGPNRGQEGSPGLQLNIQRLDSLSYKALVDKLAHTAGLSPEQAAQDAAFKKIVEKRYVLGDYNYSIRNSGSTVWETTDMTNWMDASLPYCQSQLVKAKHQTKPEAFTEALLGRPFSESDKQILAEIQKLTTKPDEQFEMNCIAHVNSLEFRNQWPRIQPKLDEYVTFLAGTMLHLPRSPVSKAATAANLEEILGEMTSSDRLLLSARSYMDHLMQTSGNADNVDYDLPSNILLATIRQKLPYGAILFSDSCYDEKGGKIACDSGTPAPAGVLSSRAFLKSRYGAYNIFRASALVKRFMCTEYPLPLDVEPQVPAEKLVDKFAATDGEGFGNGSNCYLCHSQFASHTQVFVKFDPEGIYKAEADGIEDKKVSAAGGYTATGTMASHFRDPAVSAAEKSVMLGKPVANLQEAGKVLAESDVFLDCSIRHLMQYYLRLSSEEVEDLSAELVGDIRQGILKESRQPTLQTILKKALSHPKVVETFKGG